MPDGAFEQAIANRRILVAKDNINRLLGYLFFRIARGRVAIVHLCIAPSERGKGLARLLVDKLKLITAHLECITLRCRRDFPANDVWPKLSFHPRGRVRGRGADGAELTIWHFDHGHEDLFSNLISEKTRVVIDTNIFLDLSFPIRPHHTASKGLTDAWLDEIIELVVTPEVFNDINRCENEHVCAQSRSKLTGYPLLRASADEVTNLAGKLRNQYPQLAKNERGISDINHLAYSIAAGIKYFVTRDEVVLEMATEILQAFDLQILTAIELIGKHDEIERESEYQPRRLLGTRLVTVRLRAEQVDSMVESFSHAPVEKNHEFRASVNSLLSAPRDALVQMIQDQNGQPIVLLGKCAHEDHLEIPLLRMTSHTLAPTVLRHVLMELIREAAATTAIFLTISDKNPRRDLVSAFTELGFVLQGNNWTKPLLAGFHTIASIAEKLQIHGISTAESNLDDLGTLIWPAKTDTPETPCFLVPIQAHWAEHFFDVDQASMRLPQISDIREEIHLGVEAVYYSASKNKFTAPGHVLWYVSLGPEDMGSMTVKAVSRLRGIVRGGPKELFRQFRRLGVYEWKQVYDAAHHNIKASLVALRFSHTERFLNPISKSQLSDLGIKGNLQGPMSVPHETFKTLYQLGTQLDT